MRRVLSAIGLSRHISFTALCLPLESDMAAALPPGPYAALLAGGNNGTGAGVVEVYDLGAP